MPTRRIVFIIIAAAVAAAGLAGIAQAGAVTIYSDADSGTGSLRWAVEAINANPGATNTITWYYGLGGTLTLLSDLPTITNTTLDLTNSIYDFTLADSSNSMSIGGVVTVYNDSVVSTVTINEDITGTGSLTKTGGGVLVLTGTNTYTGGTYINGGTLSTDWDGALGAASAGLSFNGGTLKILNDFSSARSITLESAGGIFNTNSYTMTLSGLISGAGGLQKVGPGTLILGGTNGANTYLGATTISVGTLQLCKDDAIPQGSTVTLASGATLDLAGHVDKIAAYSGAGTLSMKLRTDGLTNLTVTGNASIGSSYLYATFSPQQLILNGSRFTVLTADSITGHFLDVYSPAAVTFTDTYTSTTVVLTASLVPFVNIAATASQRAVGAALEPLRASATGDLATVIGNLYVLDAAGIRSALDQIGPVSLSAMRGLAISGSDMRSGALRARAADLASGDVEGLATYSGRGSQQGEMDYDDFLRFKKRAQKEGGAEKKTDAEKKVSTEKKAGTGGRGPWSFFAAASGISGKDMQEKGTSSERPGYKFDGGGLLMGADYSIAEGLAAGFAAGYGLEKADVYFPSDATVNSRNTSYGAYAAAASGDLRVNIYAGRGTDSFETKRKISFEEISRTATGDPDGKETNLEAGLAYQFHTATADGLLTPFVTVNYDRLKTDPFTETGADSLNLAVCGTDSRSLRSATGLRWSETIETGNSRIKTYISAAWGHEFDNQNLPITASLTSGGDPFTVKTGDSIRDAMKIGARISAELGGTNSTYLEYAGDFRKRLFSHSISLGWVLKF